MAAATFNVSNIEQTADYLKGAGVRHFRGQGSDIEVPPTEANGAIIGFRAKSLPKV